MRKIIIAFAILISCANWIAAYAAAPPPVANLYFTVPASPVPIGGTFSVAVMIDSSQPLNAYDVSVDIAGGSKFKYIGSNNANSIITVWQSLPTAVVATGSAPGAMPGDAIINIAGGSLAPFEGDHGELMTLNFSALATGTVDFSFGPSFVYLANGKGTRIAPATSGAESVIAPKEEGGATGIQGGAAAGSANGGNPRSKIDSVFPKIDYLHIVGDPADPSRKLLAFLVSDAGSGVKETEVRYRTGWSWSEWRTVIDPAPLSDGVWEAELRVYDNAGNAAISSVYDWGVLGLPLGISAAIAAAIVFIFAYLGFRRRGKRPIC